VSDGKIAAIGHGPAPSDETRIDAGGRLVFPGFIDLHVHGTHGCAVMDAREESIRTMAQVFARHGVTSFLPTTWTASPDATRSALETVSRCVGPQRDGATVLGAHLEGPYLNPEKCGAQQRQHIRQADVRETKTLLDLDVIRLAALAPEYEENRQFMMECICRGVAVSAAHTDATFALMNEMVGRGLHQVTHMFNAMSPLHHRAPGVVGAGLSLRSIRCELIADNLHVHPVVMDILYRIKGPEGIILITDAVEAAGQPDGEQTVDGRPVVVSNGTVCLPDGTLAGSTLTMDRALRNLAQATGEKIEDLWQATSLNAARAIGIEDRKGQLAVGMDADFAILEADGRVHMTIAEGRVTHSETGPS
jgi:N-acetylglucosamine-6-phosphate deacetylase